MRNYFFMFPLAMIFIWVGIGAQVRPPWLLSEGYGYHEYTEGDLYNANEYARTHLFFEKESYIPASVYYKGRLYNGVRIKYDLWRDVVVTLREDGFTPMMLPPAYLDSFVLFNRTFYRLRKSTDNIPDGYYEILYADGVGSKLVAHYSKSVMSKMYVNGGLYDVVHTRTDYNFSYKGKWHTVNKVADLREILGVDRKLYRAFNMDDNDPAKSFVAFLKYVSAQSN